MSRVPLVKDIYPSISHLCPVSPGGFRDLWIGEETKRSLPPHVYKYYLARTRSYRRQSLRVKLDPYGAGGWVPQPHSHHGAVGGPVYWCDRPGRSSDPVTPIGGPPLRQVDSPFHATCPVHSPFRFRYVNGGPDYYSHHQIYSADPGPEVGQGQAVSNSNLKIDQGHIQGSLYTWTEVGQGQAMSCVEQVDVAV
ncbi:hypothetical protein FQR65_LT14854 [Abscondita terminalis]|nr:hypothetical protein FQR65_LT14854 [Abscondita terminalis]